MLHNLSVLAWGARRGGQGTWSGWHHCSSEAEEEFLHTPVTWDRERRKKLSNNAAWTFIKLAWATGAPPLSYGPISSDCCLHFSLFLFYSETSNIHMSVDVFSEWTHVCLQRPGLHRSITASWKEIDFYGNSYLHCCLKFTITILIMHCRWLLCQ